MGTKQISIGVEKRFNNIKIIEKMKKFIKTKKGEKTGKIDIKDIKYSQDEYNNYYTFIIKTEMLLNNASEYIKTIINNILKSEKVNPFISSASELEPIKESYSLENFDHEKFSEEIRAELHGSSLNGFHEYSENTYLTYNNSYQNVYDDSIYIEITLDENSQGESKMTIDFDTNTEHPELKYVLEGDYHDLDVAQVLINFMDERLEQIYLEDKSLVQKFEKEEIERLAEKYPQDDYLRSLVAGNKYKLLDYYSFKESKKYNA